MSFDLEKEIIAGVERSGWYVINVVPRPDGSDGNEHCTYTIGLSKSLQWPEFICFGLNGDEASEMLRLAIAECWEDKKPPRAGLVLNKVLNEAPAKLVENEALGHYCGLADWYAEQVGLPKPKRLQLLWPDRFGVFPDDKACLPEVKAAQAPRVTG